MAKSTEFLTQRLAKFQNDMLITRVTRLQAHLRLIRRQQYSSYVISALSLYVIVISLIPLSKDLGKINNNILLICSIALSVFIIFTSLIDNSQNFFHRGEILRICARKISDIYRRSSGINVDDDFDEAQKQIDCLQNEYGGVLKECPENHDNADYLLTVSRRPNLFPEKYESDWKKSTKLFYRTRAFIGIWFWIVPHIIIIAIVTFFVVLQIR